MSRKFNIKSKLIFTYIKVTMFVYYTFFLILGCGPKLSGGPFIRVVANDFNADGIADILVGATGEDTGGSGAGAAYVFFGATSFSSSIDASLANVKLIGEVAGDNLGISVSAGDVNGDGIADMIVGANLEDSGGDIAGAAYIFYGSTSLAASIDASLASVKLIGETTGDGFGVSVSSGDVNNDGYDDIIVGANGEDSGGDRSGAVYVFYGSPSLAASIDASLANVKIIGENVEDELGTSVASGDINNNGFADIITGAALEDSGGDAAGAVYIIYGSATLAASIDASLANVKLIGEDASDTLGQAVASGDINNDGFSDLLAGAPGDTSEAYILFGSGSLAASIDASNANVKLTAGLITDNFGTSTTTGDVNNDGFYDAVVGATLQDSGGNAAGATYVFYGSSTLAATIAATAANVIIIGELANDRLGTSCSAVADINNDGMDDIITGANGEDSGGSGAGAAYIILGSATLAASIDASLANVKLIGEAANDSFGQSSVL